MKIVFFGVLIKKENLIYIKQISSNKTVYKGKFYINMRTFGCCFGEFLNNLSYNERCGFSSNIPYKQIACFWLEGCKVFTDSSKIKIINDAIINDANNNNIPYLILSYVEWILGGSTR